MNFINGFAKFFTVVLNSEALGATSAAVIVFVLGIGILTVILLKLAGNP